MGNTPKVKLYPLDDLYLAKEKRKTTVCLQVDDKRPYYIDVLNGNIYNQDIDYKIISSFLEALKENSLDILLTDSDGIQMQQLSSAKVADLLSLLERKKTLNQVVAQRNQLISNNVANLVSDLLGLNISTPSTPFKFSDKLKTKEVIVPAKKLTIFKKVFLEYVKASLLSEYNIIITYGPDGQDYRIARSLKKAKIMQTEQMKSNAFSLSCNKEGKLKINDLDINEYRKKQETGFQKTFRF